MLLTKSPYILLLGLSETHPNLSVGVDSLSIPSYQIIRRQHTSTKWQADLESGTAPSMWVEVKSTSSSATLVGYRILLLCMLGLMISCK